MAPALQLGHAMKITWTLPALSLLIASGTSSALPNPNVEATPGLRPGANHHTGDDGFVSHLGREPTAGEEKLRMHEHFIAVRDRLAAARATRPDLEAKRKKILEHLNAYIAKGTTPENAHLPWRTPVFIDDKGTICAVGYLIEQTAGRALAEKVAASHRYSFIEDIAKDMPEARAWVEESGFTLGELGQIQPGYEGPEVLLEQSGMFVDDERTPVRDGDFTQNGFHGKLVKGRMVGAWTKKGEDGKVLGSGTFSNGSGAWTSFHPNGKKLAEGEFARNKPSGAWRFYHDSGNLAAEGSFDDGQRAGAWRFYYDTPGKTPIATGRFDREGKVAGSWKHFDVNGKLLVTTSVDTPESWAKKKALFWNVGYRLDLVPLDGIEHSIHTGTVEGVTDERVDMLAKRGERVFVRAGRTYDADGFQLDEVSLGFTRVYVASDCHWGKTEKAFARRGDVAAFNALNLEHPEDATCAPASIVSPERSRRIGELVDSLSVMRSVTPELATKVALDEDVHAQDLPDTLAQNMTLDIVWPHVDGRFVGVYATLPGYRNRYM